MDESKDMNRVAVEEFEKLFLPIGPEEISKIIQSTKDDINPNSIFPIPFDDPVPAKPRAQNLKQLASFFETIWKPSPEYEQVRAEIQLEMADGRVPLEPPLHPRPPERVLPPDWFLPSEKAEDRGKKLLACAEELIDEELELDPVGWESHNCNKKCSKCQVSKILRKRVFQLFHDVHDITLK